MCDMVFGFWDNINFDGIYLLLLILYFIESLFCYKKLLDLRFIDLVLNIFYFYCYCFIYLFEVLGEKIINIGFFK